MVLKKMIAEEYDRWYETPRGRWIGQCEIELLCKELRFLPGESVLDVGCGTGFFTRAFASLTTGKVIGVDIDTELVQFGEAGRSLYPPRYAFFTSGFSSSSREAPAITSRPVSIT